MKLPREQAGIAAKILANGAFAPRGRTLEFNVPGLASPVYALVVELRSTPGISVVSTLGSASRHVFVTATDGPPNEIARVLADLEGHDAVISGLQVGDAVPLEDRWAADHGRVGIQLLPIGVSNAATGLEEVLEVGGRQYHLLLVVFLSRSERTLREDQGLDALLDRFEGARRDLVRFDSVEA